MSAIRRHLCAAVLPSLAARALASATAAAPALRHFSATRAVLAEETAKPIADAAEGSAAESTAEPVNFEALEQQERLEHAAFVGFCRKHGVDRFGVAPTAPYSASRFVRVTAEEPDGIVGLRGGRGLVATQDHEDGDTILCAPVTSMLSVDSLMKDMLRDKGDAAAAASASALPDYAAVATVLEESMLTQHYYVMQVHLALHVAYARMDPGSEFAAYFDTLPVPAINDDMVLDLHSASLTPFQVKEYQAHLKDFSVILQRLRKLWIARAGGETTDAGRRVPPMQVLHWAWRTVLGRQAPMPLTEAPTTSRRKGNEAFKAMHFVHWFRMHGREGELMPMLTPHFDLVDHGPVANAQLDVSMLPPGTTCTALNAAVKRFRMHDEQVKAAKSRGEGLDLSALSNRLPAWLQGMAHIQPGEGPSGQDEAATRELFVPRTEEERLAMVPHVQLQLLHKVKEGEQIVYRFADEDSKAFALYRFGFFPLTH